MAAQNAGLDNVPVEVVNPSDVMPGSKKTWETAFNQRMNDPRNRQAGGLVPRGGSQNQPLIKCK